MMISVQKAQQFLENSFKLSAIIDIPISKLNGHILAQDILSEREQPPFHRVMMDGIAINLESYQKGRRTFEIEGEQKAGQSISTLLDSSKCYEVMTGSVLPENTNAVIRYEDINIEGNVASITEKLQLSDMYNVHTKGSDHKVGHVVLKKGTKLFGPQIGIIAANGYERVKVFAKAKIAVISTGDELVELNQKPLDHQIRKSNPYALSSELAQFGCTDVNMFHLNDDKEVIFNKVKTILDEFDVLVFSGGVSAGKYDFLPQVFADLNIKKVFHKITQRPGKPLWFGTKDNKLIFGLPGNPISALTCLRRYVIEALERPPTKYAKLSEDFIFNKDLTYFCPVSIQYDDHGELWATPIKTNNSGDYGALATSSGFIELDKDKTKFEKGSAYKLFMWGSV